MKNVLEGIAAEVLRQADLGDGPVDAYSLCKAAKMRVYEGRRGMRATVIGRSIFVPGGEPPERQRFGAAHELSHVILRARGIRDTEWRCNWLASALLHPAPWFQARLAARGWDLAGLRADFPLSSYEAIGRRAVNLGGATLWVCDRGPRGRTSRRYCSSDVPPAVTKRPTAIEWELVKQAAHDLRPCQLDGVGAWAIPSRDTLRVIALGRGADVARLSA